MKRIITAALLSGAIATPMFAGSLDTFVAPEPVIAPVPVAYEAPGVDWTGFYAGAQGGYGFGSLDGAGSGDLDGGFGGLHAGYNYDFGQFVVGLEGDYNIADLSFDNAAGEIDQLGRLKLRGGVELGRALLYATGGGAYTNANVGGTDLSDFGYVVGAGVDYLVTPNIIGGIEYLYHDFNDIDNSGIDATVSTIAAKVSYKF